jgi:PAS domain S-box-containing protein
VCDDIKSTDQLIEELQVLRQRVKELELYKHILDQLPVCTIFYDQSERVIYRNKATEKIDGYAKQELLGLTRSQYLGLLQIEHGSDNPGMTSPPPTVDGFPEGIIGFKETTLRTKNGDTKPVLLIGSYIRDARGNLLGACGCAIDLTEYDQREKIRELFFEIMPNPVYYKDAQGLYRGCNAAFENMVGLPREKIIGRTVKDIWPSQVAAIFRYMDDALFQAPGVPQVYEAAVPYADGTTHTVIISKAAYTTGQRAVSGLVGVITDITEYKQMQRALKKSEQEKQLILEAISELVVYHDTDMSIKWANLAACQSVKTSTGQMIGRHCYEIWPLRADPCPGCPVCKSLASGQYHEGDTITPDGTIWSVKAYPVKDEHGQVVGAVEVARDVTERRQMEMEMARLERLNLVGEMAAGIGHEVRNPMTVVRGFLQVLQGKPECKGFSGYFDLMIDELDRANSIITQFLSLAKNKPLLREMYSLNTIIEKLFPLMQADAHKSDKNVDLQLGNIPQLYLDEREMRQLLLNLVRNGLEAMSSGQSVTIKTYCEGVDVVLAVQDQGCGISPDVLAKLGSPFLTTKESGTGLGLSVCYGIAARHGAKIEVLTDSQGSTFLVRFGADALVQGIERLEG